MAVRILLMYFPSLQVDNKLVTLDHSEPAIRTFYNADGKWKPLDKFKLVESLDH